MFSWKDLRGLIPTCVASVSHVQNRRVNNIYNKDNIFNMSVKCFVKYECSMCYLLLSMGLLLNHVLTRRRSIYLMIYAYIINM